MPDDKFNWFDHEHAEYRRLAPKWKVTSDVVSCDYAEVELIAEYLHQRSQGEPDEMYADRKKTVKVIPSLGKALLSITGQLFSAESEQTIEWGATLGDPADEKSRAYQLLNDIDGAGTNFTVFVRSFIFDLLKYQRWLYVLVEGPAIENGPITWKVITPETVIDWDDLRKRPRWMKLRHAVTRRAGPMDKPEDITLYSLYQEQGVERWEKKADDKTPTMTTPALRSLSPNHAMGEEPEPSEGFADEAGLFVDSPYRYEYYTDTSRSERRLPIVRSALPFKYYFAYLAARNVVGLFNMTSERRNITRMAATPLNYIKNPDPIDTCKRVMADREKGYSWIFLEPEGDIGGVTPALEIVPHMTEIIRDDRDELFNSLLQDYGDAAAQVTATKIRREERSGEEALLDLLARTLDEMVQTCLFLTEQIESANPSAWGQARVTRKGSFRPKEPEAKADREKTRYHGDEPIPLTEDTYVRHVRRQHEEDGLIGAMNEEETAAYEDELRAAWRDAEMDKKAKRYESLVAGGLASEQAAKVAGFSEEIMAMMTQTDFVPSNGEMP